VHEEGIGDKRRTNPLHSLIPRGQEKGIGCGAKAVKSATRQDGYSATLVLAGDCACVCPPSLVSPGFLLPFSLCRLEELSPETLQAVGGIVKATADLSFSFRPSLPAHNMLLCFIAHGWVRQTAACSLPTFPGATLIGALPVKDLSSVLPCQMLTWLVFFGA